MSKSPRDGADSEEGKPNLPSPRSGTMVGLPISVPSASVNIAGRGRGRGTGIMVRPTTMRQASDGDISRSAPANGGLAAPLSSSPSDSSEELQKVGYLESLVHSLNKRIEEYERQHEAMNAELEDLRQQLAEQKANPSRSSSAAPAAAPAPAPAAGESQGDVPTLQRRPSQAWAPVALRRSATPINQLAGSAPAAPSPAAAAAASGPLERSGRSFTLGGRRKEQVDERGKAVERLVDSERKYNQRLNVIVTMYIDPIRHVLGNTGAAKEAIYDIFSNVEAILAMHKLLLAELLSRWGRWSPQACLGDLFAKFLPLFTLYKELFRSGCGAAPLELGAGPDAAKIRQVLSQADSKVGEGGLNTLFTAVRSRIREYVGSCIFVNKSTDPSHADYEELARVKVELEELLASLDKASSEQQAVASAVQGSGQPAQNVMPPSSPTSLEGRSRSSSKTAFDKNKDAVKLEKKLAKKGTISKFQSGRFKDKKDKTAFEIQQKILAEIQEREKDPNLTEEERGRLKLQAAFAAQGKFEAALQVMAGNNGTSPGGTTPTAVTDKALVTETAVTSSLGLDEAVKHLFEDPNDVEFEKTFLSMYFYFLSWRELFSRIKKAYTDVKDLSTPEAMTRRNRLLDLLSAWLETNPQLRHLVMDDGPKKKKPAQPPAPVAVVVAQVSPRSSSPDATPQIPPKPSTSPQASSPRSADGAAAANKVVSPRAKPLPKPPASPATSSVREPDAIDDQIVVLCGKIREALVSIEASLSSKEDQDALKATRSATETTMQLIELVQTEKDETEPAFVDEAQVLRGNVVSLTHCIVSVIKSSFSAESFESLKGIVDSVSSQCDVLEGLAKATVREVAEAEVSQEDQDDTGDIMFEATVDPEIKAQSTTIIQNLLGETEDAKGGTGGRTDSQIYASAMNANAVFKEVAEPKPLLRSDSDGGVVLSQGSFIEVMTNFCAELPARAAEQAFCAFFQAWKNMGTAEENFRKAAQRKSVKLTKGSLAGQVPDGAPLVMDLLRDVTAQRVAQQLAVLEYQLFQAVPVEELFCGRFMVPEQSPNFNVLVTQFNIWGRWAYSEVLRRADIGERAKMIGFFIALAKESLAMNNFNTSYALVAGLNFPGLSRLKQTWNKVNKKDLEQYENLLTFWSTSRNYKTYRTAVKAAIPPAVPWFGLVAKDLFHIEDSTPTIENDKVNFNKLSLISKSIGMLQTLQKYEFVIKKDTMIQRMLADVKRQVADENEGFQLSYKYEPKPIKL